MGASLAVCGLARMASAISLLDYTSMGSSLALRRFARLGCGVSLFGRASVGSSMSVLDFAELGSTLSLRGFCRVGSSLSIFSHVRFGASFSVLDNIGFGATLHGPAMKTDEITDLSSKTVMALSDTAFELSVNSGTRAMSVQHDTINNWVTGYLHGTWHSDATITTSDRRLKTSIQPLYRTLASQAEAKMRRAGKHPTEAAADTSGRWSQDSSINWLLRELRPVSFHLKRGPEAKYLKFGFIAQELETVFPNLVRKSGEDDTYSVATQDLIAVLTMAIQNLQRNFEEQRESFSKALDEIRAQYSRERQEDRQRLERLEQILLHGTAVARLQGSK